MKRFLLFVTMLSVTVMSANATLISEWKFDEIAGSTTIADSSGNGHNGTLPGSGVSMGGTGTGFNGTGGAAYFNGTGAYITATNGLGVYSAGQYLQNQATISFWENADSTISNGGIFGGYGTRCVMTYGGYVYWDTYATSLTKLIQPTDYKQSWSFWTLVRDGSGSGVNSTSYIYRNGQQIATLSNGYSGGAGGSINSYGNLKIGIADSTSLTFKGYIDEMRVYNNAMGSSDVLSLYNSYLPEPATLVLLGLGTLVSFRRKI